jgi:putative membrane protein
VHDHGAAAGGGFVPFVPLAIALAVYLAASAGKRRGRREWSGWRTASFAAGIAMAAVAVSPPIVEWAHSDLRGHMVQHLALGMVAPLALVLGAPMTLALRALPVAHARRATSILKSGPVRWLTHPVSALVLNAGGMYVLYLTPLYQLALESVAVHWLVHVHFLMVGTLFAWSIVGPDPAPHRPRFAVRLTVVFVAMAAHAYLGKALYVHLLPAGVAEADVVREAAQLMYYGGDAAEILLLIALFVDWYRRRIRSEARPTMLNTGAA